MKKRVSLSDIIAFAALTVSIILFIKDCSQDKKIEETNYSLSQLQYKPQIKICKIKVESYTIQHLNDTMISDTLNSIANIDVELRFYITNVGNTPAKLFYEISTECISNERYIRNNLNRLRYLIDSSSFNKINNFTYDYYNYIEINTNDTIKFNRTFRISETLDSIFTIHYLVLYRNDLFQYFDTYYWARFKLNSFTGKIYKSDKQENKLVIEIPKKEAYNVIKFIDDMNFSDVYSKDEQELLTKVLNEITPANKP